ncbi:MAG: rRNA cytosine-C5-methyltransferase [Bacteroidales bacterium]|nr:rRNA cytosine-C5-methyltransferase [Bacteroidales bacterium]
MAVFPKEFTESTRAIFGGAAQTVLDALASGESVTAVRANPAKISAADLHGRFEAEGEAIPWCRDAFWLDSRPLFSLDPLLHAGAYYVQDPSAMFVGSLAGRLIEAESKPLRILDLCAAPGGKSTAIAAALREKDLLVANEVIGSRATILAENMVKWGSAQTVVTNNDPKDFSRTPGWFDILVADVPCSGEGMFRKEPKAVEEWSPENVNLCAARQRRIIADAWDSLRQGGCLIYSTCTFNRFENDDNAQWICAQLGAETVDIDINDAPGAIKTAAGVQFAPGLVRGEGQYVALLRKTAPAPRQSLFKPSRSFKKAASECLKEGMDCWYADTSAGTLIKGYPHSQAADIRFLEEKLRVLRSGVAVALVKGRDLVPQADLALSTAFRRECMPAVELTTEQALDFLRTKPLQLPDAPKGFVTVQYEQLPIGFVKNIGSRANNLFPQAWRLRM